MTNFKVEDIKGAVAELKKNGVKVLTDVKQGPNYDYVVIEDPEGNEQVVYQRVQR
ncbi:MAG: VOC family protein [SAR202 cluster bacterium]|nr:VOC family protein [SAR202 cluster bacterium]